MSLQDLPNMIVCERFRATQHERVCAHAYHKGAYYRMCKKGRALNGRLYKLFNGAGSCNIVCAECPVGERLAIMMFFPGSAIFLLIHDLFTGKDSV